MKACSTIDSYLLSHLHEYQELLSMLSFSCGQDKGLNQMQPKDDAKDSFCHIIIMNHWFYIVHFLSTQTRFYCIIYTLTRHIMVVLVSYYCSHLCPEAVGQKVPAILNITCNSHDSSYCLVTVVGKESFWSEGSNTIITSFF